ncbi:MAG: hypothetical protein JRJ62_00145 [Deltaproteobacteria bacterium]|nr:hypothetical protein [Deltaproteobacteria bacterium]
MKIWDIVRNVGSGIIREVVPGGGLLVNAINEFLPDDKKLPSTATGNDINEAVVNLPPEQRVRVLEKEFDVDITQIKESNATVRAMLESDARNPQSTRPYIAKGAFNIVAFVVVVAVSAWSYGVFTGDTDMVDTVVNGWQFILAAIAPLVTLLWAYFGVLKTEQKNKLDAANGVSTQSVVSGILSAIVNRR